jgi:hypothetical protein
MDMTAHLQLVPMLRMVKLDHSTTILPYAFMAFCLIKSRDNFSVFYTLICCDEYEYEEDDGHNE